MKFTSLALLILAGNATAQPATRVDRHGDALPPGAIARLGTTRFRHDRPVGQVHFSADGKMLLGDSYLYRSGRGRVWDADTGKLIARFRDTPIGEGAAFSPDGKLLIDRDGDQFAYLRDFATGKTLHTFGGVIAPGSKEAWKVNAAYFSRRGEVPVLHGTQKDKEVMRRFELTYSGVGRLALKELRMHPQNQETIWNLWNFSISPDARVLAGFHGDLTASLLDLDTGKKLCTLEEWKQDEAGGTSFVFSPDAKTVVGHRFEGNINFWDAATGKRIRTIDGGRIGFRVRGDPISPDSKWFAANEGNDHRVFVYELATGKLRWTFSNKGLHMGSVFSPDSKMLATHSDSAFNICIWDLGTGKEISRFDFFHNNNGSSGMAFSPDSKRVAFTSGRLIKVGDIATGKLLHPEPGHDDPPRAIFFSLDGKTLFTGGADGGIRDWDPVTGQERKRFADVSKWAALALPTDGRILAVTDRHWSVWVSDVRAHKDLAGIDDTPGSGIWKRTCAISAEGELLATTNDTGDINVFDIASRKKVRKFNGFDVGAAPPPAFSPDNRMLAALGRNTNQRNAWTVRIWELATGKERCRIACGADAGIEEWHPWQHRPSPPPMRFLPDKKTFSIATARTVCLYSIATGKELRRFSRERLVGLGSAFSADGRLLAAPDETGTIFVWDTATATLLTSFECGSAHATLLAFAPDGKRLASVGIDGAVLVWDLEHFLKKDIRNIKELETAWQTLADPNAAKALQAIVALTRQPDDALAILKKRLRPAALPDGKRFERWVADLKSSDFAKRQKATREIEMLNELAEFDLKKALVATEDVEARRRLEDLLARLVDRAPSPELAQWLRAIEALEWIGNPQARGLLLNLAGGLPAHRATIAAKLALKRLARGDCAIGR